MLKVGAVICFNTRVDKDKVKDLHLISRQTLNDPVKNDEEDNGS